MKDNAWHKAQYEIASDTQYILPVVDISAYDIGGTNEEFYIEVGPVCFS